MSGLAWLVSAGPPTFTWFGPPPTEPHVPFGGPALAVYDSLRVFCFAVGTVAICFAVVLVFRRNGAVGQRIRLVSESGLIIYVIITEAYRLGDFANLRLILGVLITAGAAWGNYLGIRYENPPPLVWRTHESGHS